MRSPAKRPAVTRPARSRATTPAPSNRDRHGGSSGHADVIGLGDISAARGNEMLLPVWLRLMGMLNPRCSTSRSSADPPADRPPGGHDTAAGAPIPLLLPGNPFRGAS